MANPQITLTGKPVGSIGYGLMGLTWRPLHLLVSQQTAFDAMFASIQAGATFWNAGEIYGSPQRNSCHLLKEYFTAHPDDASKIVLSIKGGMLPGTLHPDSSSANIHRSVNECLHILNGTCSIDIFQCARVDPSVPIESTITTLAALVKEGKIGGIGLSEVKASTIERAAKVHEIAAVEVELSLWATDIFRNGVAYTCAKHNIPIIAYSPLCRGQLAGETVRCNADIPEGSVRKAMPKFQDEVLEYNNRITDEVEALAKRKGCTKAQVAIAWVRQLSGRRMKVLNVDGGEEEVVMPAVIPIPGATTSERVRENSKVVELSEEEMEEIERVLGGNEVRGERYGEMGMKHAEG